MIRICSMSFVLFVSGLSSAQTGDSLSTIKSTYGFNFGLNQSALYNSNATDELQIKNALGFRLGVFAEFPLSKNWAIMPKSELSFNFGRVTDKNVTYRVDPYNLDMMMHFKYYYKVNYGKVQPYFVLGPNVRVPIKGEFDGLTYDTKISLAADFAFGLRIETQHFYLSPELRFSGGLTDIRKNPSGKMLRGSNAALVLNFSSK